MHSSEEKIFIDGTKNTRLHIRKFSSIKVKRVFIVFHGICEHSGRYKNLINFFLEKNSCIYLADHRGHGLSEGLQGTVEEFDDFAKDALSVIDYVNKNEKEDIFIIAHSMGGLIATYTYLMYKTTYRNIFNSTKGFILSSPAYKLKDIPDGFQSTVLKITGLLEKFFFPTLISPNQFINDAKEVENYKNDELIVKKVSPKIIHEIQLAINYCQIHIENLDIPVLVLIAGKDTIVDPSSILNHYQRMKSPDKTKIIYSNSYHELFNDIYRNKIFQDMYQWLKAKFKKKKWYSNLPFKNDT